MFDNLDYKIESLLKPTSDLITNIIFGSFTFFETQAPYIVLW